MKLAKRVMLVLSLVCISSNVASSDTANTAKIEELRKKADEIREVMPKIRAELYKQYPNPDDSDGRVVHELVQATETCAVPICVMAFEFVHKNPWILSENESIMKVAQEGLTKPLQEEIDFNTMYVRLAEVSKAYKKELDSRHPKNCSSCRTWRYPFGRCSLLHQHYNELMKLTESWAGTLATFHARDPQAFIQFKAIEAAVKASEEKTVQVAKKTKTTD